jgi:hypothetical protein
VIWERGMATCNEGRNRNRLAQRVLPMLQDLWAIRDARAAAARQTGERWRMDEVSLIDRIIRTGSACQIFDAIDVLSCGDYAGPSSVVELKMILENVRVG